MKTDRFDFNINKNKQFGVIFEGQAGSNYRCMRA